MKNHLKTLPAPKTWIIDRKSKRFITRPHPSGHPLSMGLPLGVILRDKLQVASTMAEVKKILINQEILVDGKRRKDHRYQVGLFDVLTITSTHHHYRLLLDHKGRIIITEIPAAESTIKPGKIIGKTILPGGKIQLNLHDGKNILFSKEAAVGDTIVLQVPDLKVQEVLPLKPGALVFFTEGKHSGDLGQLKEIKGIQVVYSQAGKDIETTKKYAFVLGNKKAIITLPE